MIELLCLIEITAMGDVKTCLILLLFQTLDLDFVVQLLDC